MRTQRLYSLLRWVIGGLMSVGGLVLLMTSELDKYAGMLRVLSIVAILAGISFTALTTLANREDAKPDLLCLLAFVPIFLYATWLVYCYRANSINSVIWAYVVEVGTVIMAMIGFFRIAGFPFNAPKPWRCPSCIRTVTMRTIEVRIRTISTIMDKAVMEHPP